jgi:hypothetical protein
VIAIGPAPVSVTGEEKDTLVVVEIVMFAPKETAPAPFCIKAPVRVAFDPEGRVSSPELIT